MYANITWQDVDTVLLDMGGTSLDLAFDDYFRQKLVLETWGTKNGVTPQEVMEYMRQQYRDVQRTLDWCCLDYWNEQLGLGICAMTTEMGPRAVLREDTIPFLEALKASGKQRILFTNVHLHSLAVKFGRTSLGAHLDLLPSTHTFGYLKKDQWLWHAVAEATGFKTERTLFIDDSEVILDAVVQFDICYCLGVTDPDSGIAEKQYQRHPSLDDYRRLIPSLV